MRRHAPDDALLSQRNAAAFAAKSMMPAFAPAVLARSRKPPDAVLTGRTTSPTCGLLVLAHVPKTGGSTVSEVLQGLPGGWNFLGRPQSGHPRFFAAYGKTFYGTPGFSWSGLGDCARFRNASAPHGGSASIEGSRCGGVPDWRRSLIIVDFHEPRGLLKFHHAFMPKLHELREKYAAAGCAMQLGTVLREPTSQMLSEYLYFHVQFARSLHDNATKQESTLLSSWLPGRANPQLAWLRGRTCRMHGVIFLCTTPPREPCGDDFNGLALSQHAEAERKAASVAIRMLSEFDVVGTSHHVGDVIWAMAARAGFVLDRGSSQSASSHSSRSSGGSHSGGGGGGATAGGGGGRNDASNSSAGKMPSLFSAPKCNPPSRFGLISTSNLSPDTLAVIERHSRCDRLLFEAAQIRESADLEFAAALEHRLFRRRTAPASLEAEATADMHAPLPPPAERAESPASLATRWATSYVGELYLNGSAYRTASAAKLEAANGLLNLDPSLFAARNHEEMHLRLRRNFSAVFFCKVSR